MEGSCAAVLASLWGSAALKKITLANVGGIRFCVAELNVQPFSSKESRVYFPSGKKGYVTLPGVGKPVLYKTGADKIGSGKIGRGPEKIGGFFWKKPAPRAPGRKNCNFSNIKKVRIFSDTH